MLKEKQKHPNALVLSHPECVKAVLELSDYIGSTAGIIGYAHKSEEKEFIICPEHGVVFQLEKNDPDKSFYFVEHCPVCVNMKKNTLDKVLAVLKEENNTVEVSEDVRRKALIPLDRMLELAK